MEKKKDEKLKSVEEIATFCKRKGFIFPNSEIYGGLAGFFDYGPLGVLMKQNIKEIYRNFFVIERDDIVEIDGSIISNPKVWKASGHVDNFGDLVLTTEKTKTKIRADHFIEDKLGIPADGMSAEDINELIKKHNLTYNGEKFKEIENFNIMFSTNVGASVDKNTKAYLRPETCQNIFVDFKLVQESARKKLPFGILQIGKAFRNEISPRDFLFRCREFEQIELEYFFNPDIEDSFEDEDDILNQKISFLSAENQDNDKQDMEVITIKELIKKGKAVKIHAYWIGKFFQFLTKKIGIKLENLRLREHVKNELSHYSKGTFDIDYKFPFGFKELTGIANRSNYDLTQHQKFSKTKMSVVDDRDGSKLIPSVIEPSMGFDRLFLAIINEVYNYDNERDNVVLKLNHKISPFKVAVFPLVNKEEIISKSKELLKDLKKEGLNAFFDKSGSIGRRYARQDEIGTPFCLTIDYETVEEGEKFGTLTIRDRDSKEQKRISLDNSTAIIMSLIKGYLRFEDI